MHNRIKNGKGTKWAPLPWKMERTERKAYGFLHFLVVCLIRRICAYAMPFFFLITRTARREPEISTTLIAEISIQTKGEPL